MSVTDRVAIYVFRDPHFAPAGDTFVSAAPLEAVVRVYGGGGSKILRAFQRLSVVRPSFGTTRQANITLAFGALAKLPNFAMH